MNLLDGVFKGDSLGDLLRRRGKQLVLGQQNQLLNACSPVLHHGL